MPRPRNTAPAYRRHAGTGQAVCTVRLPDGRRHDLYLGKFDSPASRAEYRRVLAAVAAHGGVDPADAPDLTVAECLVRYAAFIDHYYRHPDGTPTGTAEDIRVALGYLRRVAADCRVAAFGAPELKAVRDAMVADGRVRNQVNKRVSTIRSFARWCVEERLAPAEFRSGKSVKKRTRLSKAGNARLRTALYLPTLTAIRFNPVLRAFYARLRDPDRAGGAKPKMQAVGACMRKPLMICYGVLKNRAPFDPHWAGAHPAGGGSPVEPPPAG